MKIAIMQPYFFPYLGYFQLIDSVDLYVNLDHVNFMKSSYMTRNLIKNNTAINLNVYGGSQNKKCHEVIINFENNYIQKFKKTLFHLYSKSKNYDFILDEIIDPLFIDQKVSISQFNINLIKKISKYLEIDTKIIDSSIDITDRKKADGLIDICQQYNSSVYINAIGGQSLYNKEYFKEFNIELFFIKMEKNDLENQYASILDIIFNYDIDFIKTELKKYSLI